MKPQDSPPPRRRRSHAGLFFAILAIVIGALILASNTGTVLALYKSLLFSWPMLVIVLGLCGLIFHHRFSFGALYVVIAGIFFLIPRIEANEMTLFGWQIPQEFAKTYWPALLIVAGALGVTRWIVRPRTHYHKYWGGESAHFRHCTHHDFKKGEVNAVFGRGKHIILDPAFEGGEVNAIFSEVTLDLRKAGLPEGKPALLEVNIVFGNAIILVPENWHVEMQTTPVIGGFMDRRDNIEGPHDMSRILKISVNSVFSGGELRN